MFANFLNKRKFILQISIATKVKTSKKNCCNGTKFTEYILHGKTTIINSDITEKVWKQILWYNLLCSRSTISPNN